MTNETINIAIDHGNNYIKSVTDDLEFMVDNGLTRRGQFMDSKGVIKYNGERYQVNGRSKYLMDKTKTKVFFIATLPIYAMVLKSKGRCTGKFRLAIGVAVSHGFLKESYIKYFTNEGKMIEFNYEGVDYSVEIEEAFCFSQSLAAYAANHKLYKDSLSGNIIDNGLKTCDIFRMVRNSPDLNTATSLNLGMLSLFKEIQEQIRRDTGIELDEETIRLNLMNDNVIKDEQIEKIIKECSLKYLADLENEMIESNFEIEISDNIICGGGGVFLYKLLYDLPPNKRKIGRFQLMPDPQMANAKGYLYLMKQIIKRR